MSDVVFVTGIFIMSISIFHPLCLRYANIETTHRDTETPDCRNFARRRAEKNLSLKQTSDIWLSVILQNPLLTPEHKLKKRWLSEEVKRLQSGVCKWETTCLASEKTPTHTRRFLWCEAPRCVILTWAAKCPSAASSSCPSSRLALGYDKICLRKTLMRKYRFR